MEDKLLFRLALVCSVIGLIGLYFISDFTSNVVYDFEEGDYLTVKGKVKNSVIGDLVVFELITENEIFKVKAMPGEIKIEDGMKVSVEGELIKNGRLLIIEARIIRIL